MKVIGVPDFAAAGKLSRGEPIITLSARRIWI